jgi:hypothetical protein
MFFAHLELTERRRALTALREHGHQLTVRLFAPRFERKDAAREGGGFFEIVLPLRGCGEMRERCQRHLLKTLALDHDPGFKIGRFVQVKIVQKISAITRNDGFELAGFAFSGAAQ